MAGVCLSSVQPNTRRRRDSIWQELLDDLSQTHSVLGTTAYSATPADVLGFLEQAWLPKHGATVLPGGFKVAAPHSLENAVSALASGFDELGRSGPWQPTTKQGNPCRCPLVKQFQQGYEKQLFSRGYAQKAAVPLSWNDLLAALSHLRQTALAQPLGSMQQCLSFRNGTLLSLLYASNLRAHDAGKLLVHDVLEFQSGASLLEHVMAGNRLAAGDQYAVLPYGVKNRQEANAGKVTSSDVSLLVTEFVYIETNIDTSLHNVHAGVVFCTISPEVSMNTSHWMECYAKSSKQLGQPLQKYLFRPQTKDGKGFQEKALSTCNINHAVIKTLSAAGKFDGHSTHR